MACYILVPGLRIELAPSALEAPSLHYQTAREAPCTKIFLKMYTSPKRCKLSGSPNIFIKNQESLWGVNPEHFEEISWILSLNICYFSFYSLGNGL